MMIELGDYSMAKLPAGTPMTLGPSLDFLWIRPHQICKRPLSGDFHHSVNFPDLIKSVNVRGQSTMDTKNLVLDIKPQVPSITAASGK